MDLQNTSAFDRAGAIHQSGEHFRLLVESVQDYGIFMLDPQGRIASWNAGAERIKGYSDTEVLGRHFSLFYTPADLDRQYPDYELEVAAREGRFEDEGWRLRKDGSRFWANVVITALRGADGVLVGFAKVTRDLTERKRAEEEARRSTERFQSLIVATTQIVWVTDPEGLVLPGQTEWGAFTGQSAEETTAWGWLDAVHPDDRDRTVEAWSAAVGNRSLYEVEHRLRRRDGEYRTFSVRAVPVLEADGRIREWVGTHTDITEERRTQNALQESETTYRNLFDSLAELVYIQDLEGRFLNVNEAVLRRYGFSREEIIGRTPDLLADPERADMASVQEHFRRACEGEPQQFEFWGRTRDGECFPKEVALTRGHYFGEDVVIAVARDITERKKVEAALRKSEERFQIVAELTNDAIWEVDPATGQIVWNVRFESIFGGAAEDLQAWEERIHPEDRGSVLSSFDALLERQVSVWIAEYRFLRADGTYAYVYDRAKAVYGKEGMLVRVIGAMMDISERRQTEEHEKELLREQTIRAEAEATNRAKTDFLSRMSHELRTPLNAVLGFGQLLEMDVETDENRESVSQILKAGQHLLALIDEVLDIARIDAGQMSLSVEPVSVRSVLQESADLVRLTAANQGVTLRAADALASEHFVRADQQRLKQVLLNLLSNAIKYNRHRGTVTLSCEEMGDERLRISVRDTGYGIPAEKLQRLFVPFDRLDAESSGVEGTGLGLALSRGLVEAMGGKLGVESVEEEGSRFWVELPLDPRPAVAESAPEKEQAEIPPETMTGSHTVLFVEDNLANVRLMERIFQRRPQVRLVTAMQGSLGLELAREHAPDLILLDLNLPDLSGDKVLLRLRQDPRLRDIPVVMISGDAIPSQVQRMLELGADGYITKPLKVEELLRLVDENLQAEKRRAV